MTVQDLMRAPEPVTSVDYLSDGFPIAARFYGEPGQRPKYIWLHGAASSPVFSDSLLRRLAVKFGPIAAPWLPCHGYSGDVVSFDAMAVRISEWVELRSLHQCYWLGHSMGGLISIAALTARPELGAGLATIATPLGVPVHPETAWDWCYRGGLLTLDTMVTISGAMSRAIIAGNVDYLRELMLACTTAGRIALTYQILLTCPDLLPALQDLAATGLPTTQVWAGLDPVVRPPRQLLPGVSVTVGGKHHCFPTDGSDSSFRALSGVLAAINGELPTPSRRRLSRLNWAPAP